MRLICGLRLHGCSKGSRLPHPRPGMWPPAQVICGPFPSYLPVLSEAQYAAAVRLIRGPFHGRRPTRLIHGPAHLTMPCLIRHQICSRPAHLQLPAQHYLQPSLPCLHTRKYH